MCNVSETHPLHGTLTQAQIDLLNTMRIEGRLCDAVLLTEDGGSFPVHRGYMCTCSPYFLALFNSPLHRTRTNRITIPGVSADNLRLIVEYAYTGSTTELTTDNACDLLVDADQFDVSGLVHSCRRFIVSHLEPDNCVGVCRFARDFLLPALEVDAHLYLLRHFEAVAADSDEVLQLTAAELITLVASDELNARNEGVVWDLVVRWVALDPANRQRHIGLLMSYVRLGLLPEKDFNDIVKFHPLVLQSNHCRSIVRDTERFLRLLRYPRTRAASSIETPPLAKPRIPHDILFTIGGWNTGSPTNTVETYDVRANRWKEIEEVDPIGPRAYHGCCAIDHLIYIIGGYDGTEHFSSCRTFNVVTKQWKEIAPMNCRRCYVSVVELDGLVYAMGGYDGTHRQNTAEKYDCLTNQWSMIPNMHENRSDASATKLNGIIYIVGGFNGQACMNNGERYDPTTDQWSLISCMKTCRSGVSCIGYGDRIYALGGFNGTRRLRTCESYHIDTDTWTSISDMITTRSNFSVQVLEDKLFAIGGFDGRTTINRVEYYDFHSEQWFEAANLNQFRSALGSCVVEEVPNVTEYVESGRSLVPIIGETRESGVRG